MSTRTAVAFCLAIACAGVAEGGQDARGTPKTLRWGVCEREAPKLLGGLVPVQADGKKIRMPKKIRDARPEYSPAAADLRSTMWAGEFFIDQGGNVRTIWVVRHMSPAYDAAIARALRKWEYQPMLVDGVATPVCVHLTISVHF